MVFKKQKIYNLIFLIVVAVLLFTPVGTQFKVWVNRLVAFSPSIIEIEEREKISNYNGQLVNLYTGQAIDFSKSRGRVILISFWATWCPPCIAEMPSIQSLYNDFGDKIDFYLVTSENATKVSSFLKENNYSMPVYINALNMPEQLYSKSIPATFIIDKNGGIAVKKIGAANWNGDEVRNLLNNLIE